MEAVMAAIKMHGIFSLLVLLSGNLCIASTSEPLEFSHHPLSVPGSTKVFGSTPAITEDTDSMSSGASSRRSSGVLEEETVKPSRYDAEEIISEIQRTPKRYYLEGRLLIKGAVFSMIKAGDEEIIEKFKKALEKFKEPSGLMWSCSAHYYPDTKNVGILISVPK